MSRGQLPSFDERHPGHGARADRTAPALTAAPGDLPDGRPLSPDAGDADRAERRAAAAARRALDRRVGAVLDSVTHAFLALDPEWRVVYANPEAARLNGTTPAGLIGGNHWTIWPETLGSAVEVNYRAVVSTGEPAHFVHFYPGAAVWHEIHAYRADDGGVAVLYRDITAERRAAEEEERLTAALAERERELAALLATATDVVARVDRDTRYLYVNPAITRATGLAMSEVIGHTPAELGMPAALVAEWTECVEMVYATGSEREVAFEYPTPHGQRHFEARIIPEGDGRGGVRSVLALTRDVTERVHAQQQLASALSQAESARDQAEAANRAKSEFLAVMSHELRTPLNAIRGYAELLALEVYGPVSGAQREAFERIAQSERHLLGLITEILDFARLESGRAVYHLADVPLADVLAETQALVEPQLRAKGLHFDYQPPASADAALLVRADPRKLRQIVLNLLSNALKFTAAGGRVTLRAAAAGATTRVEVGDTGSGIPTEELERVFEPFVQLNRSRSNPVSGTGLGLAISRDLARGMGGDLTAASELGVGSTFTLTLPAAEGRDR